MDGFSNGDLRFSVYDGGDPDGAPVVLLHGFPQQPSSFDEVRVILHDAGLRTLTPTQRGYTATARPGSRREYRLSALVSDVVALLDEAGLERAHIVGHDWGGFQAWGVAGLHPDRVASVTVLSTPHPAAVTRALANSTQGLRFWYMGFFQLPVVPEWLASRTVRKTLADSRLPARHVDEYATALEEPGALTAALNWYRGIPFSRDVRFGRIPVPTTYVWGARDPVLTRQAAEGTAAYVTGPYTFVELDAGHWLPERAPTAVASAIIDRVRSVDEPAL